MPDHLTVGSRVWVWGRIMLGYIRHGSICIKGGSYGRGRIATVVSVNALPSMAYQLLFDDGTEFCSLGCQLKRARGRRPRFKVPQSIRIYSGLKRVF